MASLIDAAQAGDVDRVRALLKRGRYPVDCFDSSGMTSLHYACSNGDLHVVRVLVSEFKANVNVQAIIGKNFCTPLHYACEEGHVGTVKALVSEFQGPDQAGQVWSISIALCLSGRACGCCQTIIVRVQG